MSTHHRDALEMHAEAYMSRIIAVVALGLLWCVAPLLYGLRAVTEHTVVFVVLIAAALIVFGVLWSVERVRFTLTDTLVMAYGLWGLGSVLWVREFSVDPLRLYGWCGLFLLYLLVRNFRAEEVRAFLSFVVLSGVIQACIGGAQFLGFLPPGHADFVVTGSFFNPGPLGGYLTVYLVLTVGLCFEEAKRRGRAFWMLAASVLIMTFVLVLADSRAAWLSVVVAFFVGAVWMTNRQPVKRALRIGICVLLPVLLLLLYGYRPDSVRSRLFLWEVSAGMFADRPVLGHGAGSYASKYMLYQADYFAHHPDSSLAVSASNNMVPYNEFLHVLCDLGMVGFFLLLAVLLSALTRSRNEGSFHHQTGNQQKMSGYAENRNSTLIRVGLVAMVVFSCFSYPASVFPLKMYFPLLIGMVPGRAIYERTLPRGVVRFMLSVGIVVLLSSSAVGFTRTHHAHITLQGMLERDAEAIARSIHDFPTYKYHADYVLNHARLLFLHGYYRESVTPLKQAALLVPSSTCYGHLGKPSRDRVNTKRQRIALKKLH